MGLFRKIGRLARLTPAPDELAPGIPRPTATLAHMLVAEMFQNLDVKCDGVRDYYEHTSLMVFPSFAFKVYASGHFKTNPFQVFGVLSLREFQLTSGVPVVFENYDQKIILDGWMRWYVHRQKLQTLRDAEVNQQKALDAIASLMGISEEAPKPKHKGLDCFVCWGKNKKDCDCDRDVDCGMKGDKDVRS